MNCFSIYVYVSNYTPRGNYAVFDVYTTLASVIALMYYMLILFYQQHLLVDGAVSSVTLQMSSSFNYVGYNLLLTHLPRSPQFSRLSQPSLTSASVVCSSVSVVLLGCWLDLNSLLRSVRTRHLVTSLGVDSRCRLVTWFSRAFSTIYISRLLGCSLALWHSSFNYTASLLVSMFTALCLVSVLLLGLFCASLLVCDRLSARAVVSLF